MLTEQEYLWLWGVYLSAALTVAAIAGAWLSWVRPAALRLFLRGLIVLTAVMPVQWPAFDHQWVPAAAAVFFGIVTRESALHTVAPGWVAGVGAIAVGVVLVTLFNAIRRRLSR